MSITNMNRLYLICTNLNAVKNKLPQYNPFDHVGFTEEIQVMENMVNRMREILDDMRAEGIE